MKIESYSELKDIVTSLIEEYPLEDIFEMLADRLTMQGHIQGRPDWVKAAKAIEVILPFVTDLKGGNE